MEILVLHPGALGDIILSLPALARLRAKWPQARITLAGNVDHAAAVARNYADRFISLSSLPLHRLHGPDALAAEDIALWRSFGRIVSWTGHGDPGYAAKLLSANPDAIVAPWRPRREDGRHAGQIFLDSLSPWMGGAGMLVPARIDLEPSAVAQGREWLERSGSRPSDSVLAIHPGAGSPAKCWPVEKFSILCSRLALKPDQRLLLIEGPAERGLGAVLASERGSGRRLVARRLPLDLLAGVLSHCRMWIGNDSGIAHLAAGLGLRCIVLFGPTQPRHWAPPGAQVRVVRSNAGCSACRGESASEHSCMDGISVEMVLSCVNARA